MILGKNIIMTLGDTTRGIAVSKSCHLSINTEFIEVCSPVDGSWKEFLPSINSWSASVDTLVSSLNDHQTLLQKQTNKEKLVCCFFDTELQEFYKGYCYIKNLDLKATVGGLAQMTVAIQPTGKLEWAEEEESIQGTIINNVQINFPFSVSSVSGSNLFVADIDVDTDTRVTLPPGYVLFDGNASTIKSLLIALNNAALVPRIIFENSSTVNKSVVLKAGASSYTVTFAGDATNNDVKILSKF